MPENIDGISIHGTLTGRPQENHPFLYWEFHEGQGSKQAVRMGHWKGVRLDPKQPLELYDLNADLGEQTDVAAQHPTSCKQ